VVDTAVAWATRTAVPPHTRKSSSAVSAAVAGSAAYRSLASVRAMVVNCGRSAFSTSKL
jgi:hypothetical protein